MSEVSAKFQRIGWGPVPNQSHDLGTDLLVQARDLRRFDRGLIVGVQVKAGPSWFEDEELDQNGEVIGWWYYEPDTSHFDDWVTHGLPHLVVLHDLDQNVSYWVHVTAEQVISTGRGCKILVHADHTIDPDQVESLLEVAARQKAGTMVEGTAFSARAQAIAPARRLRHALIAPRLVAPHRNLGHDQAIGPEEAIALLAQGRFVDLHRFSERHASVPDPEGLDDVRDWRWSFVRALWSWSDTDNVDVLRHAFATARDKPSRAASAVVLVCALLRQEHHRKALEILDEVIRRDDLGPVDHGWVLVQRARVRAELGNITEARNDAADAQRQFLGDADDFTVSALAAAAAWQLFVTADFQDRDLERVLTVSDTAVAWWRSQTISWALDEASQRVFRAWAEDRSHRWSVEDREAINLFAAELNADLTAEHGNWRAVAALGGRHQLVGAQASEDERRNVIDGLDALRRSGEAKSLKLAVNHLLHVGPADGVAEALARITFESWTHTTAQANFAFWAAAGDLVSESAATEGALWCADLLSGGAREFMELIRPTFMVNVAAAEALASLLPAARPSTHEPIARLLADRSTQMHDVLAKAFANLVQPLAFSEVSHETREGLWDFGRRDRGQVGAAVLGWLADNNHEHAKAEVLVRATAGDLHALAAMGDVTVLDPQAAQQLIMTFEGMVLQTIEEAAQSTYCFGAFDGAHGLALFNLCFPDRARWDILIALLADPRVAAEHKRGACELIVALSRRLLPEIREQLAVNAEAIASTQDRDFPGGRSIGGLGVAVAVVVGGIQGASADAAVARLALGSMQERRDAADLLGHGWCERMRPILASFIADRRVAVKSAAARAVGRLAATERGEVMLTLAEQAASDRGVVVPRALTAGFSRSDDLPQRVWDLVAKLSTHRASSVRRMAQSIANRINRDPRP